MMNIARVGAQVLVALGTLSGLAEAQVDQSALFEHLRWRNIGPANMAGRVTDIEAVDGHFQTVLVASASGGVWKSSNAGTTWEQIFAGYGSGSIGDIAISHSDSNLIWVGTGESCARNSVGWGDGVYKSTDGGQTFTHVGLRDTHHISEVLIHPTDPDIVYVAAQGHLWGHSGQRGLFKSNDGGASWTLLKSGLPDDGRTGASDLVMDPSDPDVLYVAFWERLRQPHRFDSGGPNGGIFKSTDGGAHWTRFSTGLPEGDTGKIGLAVSRSNPQVVMAIVEHGYQPPRRSDGAPNAEYEDMSRLGTGIYRSEDGGRSWDYVSRYNSRPFYYSHIFIDPLDDQRVYVLAGSASISEDGGRTFARTLQGISGDFHALWIHPTRPDIFYVGNDKGSYVTFDRGEHFVMFDNMDIGQFYAVTVDNRDPYWVYGGLQDNGNWGGPSNSRDWNGILTDHWFKFHSGDGFHTTVDPHDWRTVYTEAQGGRIRRRDVVFRQAGKDITPTPATVLNYADLFGDVEDAGPRLPRESFRFNWSSPLILSPHDSNTILFGGNYLFRSTNRGETWKIISSDLSTARPELIERESGGLTRDVTGAETHAALITVAESPITPGLIWAGTDDGNVQMTRNGGRNWLNVRDRIPGVPDGLWVSRVEPSRFEAGRTYVSFDGHRSDNFQPWLFRTDDYGESWTRISSDLPSDHPVYVIREDLRNPDLLFVGTEFGVFATLNAGRQWSKLGRGFPTVAVHDLVIHPRDGDLIAATHGRSIWILDDITSLQQATAEVLSSGPHLFENRTATLWKGVSRGATRGHKLFMGRNPLSIAQRAPGNSPSELENSAAINFYLPTVPGEPLQLTVTTMDGKQTFSTEISAARGINRHMWNLRFDPTEEDREAAEERRLEFQRRSGRAGRNGRRGARVQGKAAVAGVYRVTLAVDGKILSTTLAVREDPGLGSHTNMPQ